jgi:hypothetical protein
MHLAVPQLHFTSNQGGNGRVELDSILAGAFAIQAVAKGAVFFVKFPTLLQMGSVGRKGVRKVGL